MRDQWLLEHVGDEARPTDAFEASLAEVLRSEWRQPTARVVPAGAARRRTWARPLMAAAAVLAALGGGIYLLGRDDSPRITGSSTVTTAAPTTPAPTATTVAPTTPTTQPPDPLVAQTPDEQAVLDYLTALAEGRYDDAARLLGEGGLEWTGRADLRPLVGSDGMLDDLPAALQSWCESPAMCRLPTALSTVDRRVVATFTIDGTQRSSTFVGGTFEGSPLVQGLPLRLPPVRVSLADTVACPTVGVDTTSFADLDGDGWAEVVVVVSDPAGSLSIEVCGTTLVAPALAVADAASFSLFTLDIEGDGRDELLAGHSPADVYAGAVIRWDGTSLVFTGQQVSHDPTTPASGTSYGCEDMTGDGRRELVLYSYLYEGGTDLSNSTALVFTRTVQNDDGSVNPIPLPVGRYVLPAEVEQAFRIISPHCGVLPVQTG